MTRHAPALFALCASAVIASPADYDLNGDQRIDGADLAAMVAMWGSPYGGADLAVLLASWGAAWGTLHHTGGGCNYTVTLTADDPAHHAPVTMPSPWPGYERFRLPSGSFIDVEAES